MPFRYACFISYPSVTGNLGKSIIQRLTTTLKDRLELDLREGVFLDEERLKPSSIYNEQLARDLCQSICWIVVYLPIYEEHSYCNREFTAMEHLLEKRIEFLGDRANPELGMIIPVIFRGFEDLPSRIKGRFQCSNFSKFLTYSLDFSQEKEYETKIQEIVDIIGEHAKTFKHLGLEMCKKCDSFALPTAEECPPWREESKKEQMLPFHEVKQ